jgi:hypothetical protein
MKNIFLNNIIFSLLLFIISLQIHSQDVNNEVNQISPQEFIKQTLSDFNGSDEKKKILTFDRVTMIIVSLEKAKGWESENGKAVISLIEKKKSVKVTASLKKLLKDDLTGAVEIFSDYFTRPGEKESETAVKVLRENGYNLAADAIGTIYPQLYTPDRITCWARIPADKRKPIDDFMQMRYRPGDLSRGTMIDVILKMADEPPVGGLSADNYFALATRFGKDTRFFNMGTAYDFYYKRKLQMAAKIAKWLAKDKPADIELQRSVAKSLLDFGESHDNVIKFYNELINNTSEPYKRDIRFEYYEMLKKKRLVSDKESLAGIQQNGDALCAGDAFIVDALYEKATEKYILIMDDKNADIYQRSAAWSGLMDSDPVSAFKYVDDVISAIEAIKDKESKVKLAVWLGWQLNRMVMHEIPLAPGRSIRNSRLQYKPIYDVKEWKNECALIMERLVKIDPVAFLTPEKDTRKSLRYTAALLFALSGDNIKADEIIRREIKYMKDPPPGGWPFPPGSPDKDIKSPREFVSPDSMEIESLMLELMPALTRYNVANQTSPTAIINMQLPNFELMKVQNNQIVKSQNDTEIKSALIALGEQYYQSISFVDPLQRNLRIDKPAPAAREVNMKQVEELNTLIKSTFIDDIVCRNAPYFLRVGDLKYDNQFYGGMLKAMLTASNPELLKEMTKLTIYILDKYQQSAGSEKAAQEADIIINYISGRKIYDMTEYVKELRTKYPKSEVKKN